MSQKVQHALNVNGARHEVIDFPYTTLLGVLLGDLNLTGTKYGCGRGECGACTVHLDGKPALSCQCELSEIGGRKITTIEGLSPESAFALYEAWGAENLKPCNRCQSGVIMRAADLLARVPQPSAAQIVDHLRPYDCNCGAQGVLVQVVTRAAAALEPCNG